MGFFKLCLDEYNDYVSDNIRYNSLSHRLSKLEEKDFTKFLNVDESDTKTPSEVDHEAQLARFKESK